MSANPSAFLGSLVLTEGREVSQSRWDVYLRRLAYESPRFSKSDVLGLSALKLISDYESLSLLFFDSFKSNNDEAIIHDSMLAALKAYDVTKLLPSELAHFVLARRSDIPAILEPPKELLIPNSLLVEILRRFRQSLPGTGKSKLTVIDDQIALI